MIVLVTSYCCGVFVAFKATELNKSCMTALLLFFSHYLNIMEISRCEN